MLHYLLLTLAVFYIWETARAVLPWHVPGAAIAVILLAIAYGLDAYVPDHFLALGAVVAIVGVLEQKFGSAREEGRTIHVARGGRIPPLPGSR